MNWNEKCYCGHAKRSHHSIAGVIGAGLRLYMRCKYCDCKKYSPKSAGKEEWERLKKIVEENESRLETKKRIP